ncbi:MAG: 6-carboxytetrahydropterin synthase [Candidatus Thermoplasmatota archaeon]
MMVKVDGWAAGITFSAAHFLPRHDKCGRLHGHMYALHAHLHGRKGEEGVLIDFLKLKGAMRSAVQELDHKVIIPLRGEGLVVKKEGEGVHVSYDNKRYLFPSEDVVLLEIAAPTAEELAEYLLQKLMNLLGDVEGIERIEVGVDEGMGQGAWTSREP